MNPIQKIYQSMRPNKLLDGSKVCFVESEQFDCLARFEGGVFDGKELTFLEIEDMIWHLQEVRKMMEEVSSMP